MRPLPSFRTVLSDFPHSQHRPVIIEIGIQIPIVESTPRPRWNFTKANWPEYAMQLDTCVRFIEPKAKNYHRFVGMVLAIAKKHIPRGFRREYIPGWTEESQQLYNEFEESGDPEIADNLLSSLDSTRLNKWKSTVEHLDFSRSSRKAWGLLRRLGEASRGQHLNNSTIDPNKIANRIVMVSRAPSDKTHTVSTKKALKQLKTNTPPTSEYSSDFTIDEINQALSQTKVGKAAGFDGMYPEFLVHSGARTRQWLKDFFSDVMETSVLPPEFKRTKIIAILKPGKDSELPENYRPIALLSCCYKLLERLIYNRIYNTIDAAVPVEQAGFRSGRSCCDQVLSLTTFIEAGFEKCEKTAVTFIDLTAAYDTVWREGLLYKLMRVIPCLKTCHLINSLLTNRLFQVYINGTMSDVRKLNNGLPQGSVLAPLLFNIYTADLPETKSKKFAYADDLAIAFRDSNKTTGERILNEDLIALGDYFKRWRLCPNTSKTEACLFHLSNRYANDTLNVTFNGRVIKHNYTPKYLGVTLDRTLTFREHLTNTAAKIRTRNNIITKLAGTSWGAAATTLRTSALALVYSAAEYCAPVWLNSAHTNKVDVQLNQTMRIITGTIKPTPVRWLPTLSNIAPPDIRRSTALAREYQKILLNERLPIHEEAPYITQGRRRLKSRHPPIRTASEMTNEYSMKDQWTTRWLPTTESDHIKITNLEDGFNGSLLPRPTWSKLNRIRTGQGKCADSLHQWGLADSPQCDCGSPRQTIRHIVSDCPNRAYGGNLQDFTECCQGAIEWLCKLDINI